MESLKNNKEVYLKLVIIIAIILFFVGILLLIFYQDGIPYIIASALIQLGITLFVVDLFISNFARKVFQKEIMKNFREVLGITNPRNKLFPELIRLMRPHPYHVLDMKVDNNLVYDEKNKKKEYNLLIIEKSIVNVQAREDNVHYHFFRGTETGANSHEFLKEIKLNGVILDKDKDLIINNNKEKKIMEYQIKHKLKNGKIYTIEIVYHHSACMSDLRFGKVTYDEFRQDFIELTNRVKMIFRFPFSLKDYFFTIRRGDACNRETFIRPNLKKNILTVEQENLDNGDFVEVSYKKKLV